MIISFVSGDGSADTLEPRTDANDLITIGDYLRYAALNNAGLKAAFE